MRYDFGELIFGGSYFRNFTVLGALKRFRSSSFLGRIMLMLVVVIYLVFVTQYRKVTAKNHVNLPMWEGNARL